MRYLFVALLTLAFGIGTWLFGWLAIPLMAAVYALMRRDFRAPREAGFAALLAWLLLLMRLKSYPAFDTLLDQLGQIFPIPGVAVAAVALVLAVLLAASAARVTIGVTGVRAPSE